MTDFTDSYINLLLKQYWDMPMLGLRLSYRLRHGSGPSIFLYSFIDEFDLDNATGDRLDIIGRIVGIDRIIKYVVPKIAFGFDENDDARGFDDKFVSIADRAPFLDKFQRAYTDLELDDNGYRFFIRAKIAKNTSSPYLAEEDGLSIQEAINTMFDGQAYAVDKKNMSMLLYLSPEYDADKLRAILLLNLLPKPHGVQWQWAYVVEAASGDTFGFSDNIYAQPFANKFDTTTEPGGRFANKLI